MQTIIEVKNLKKIYKDNKVALDNVNLDIFKGEIKKRKKYFKVNKNENPFNKLLSLNLK